MLMLLDPDWSAGPERGGNGRAHVQAPGRHWAVARFGTDRSRRRTAARTGSPPAGRTGPGRRRGWRAAHAPWLAPATLRVAHRCRDDADPRRAGGCDWSPPAVRHIGPR